MVHGPDPDRLDPVVVHEDLVMHLFGEGVAKGSRDRRRCGSRLEVRLDHPLAEGGIDGRGLAMPRVDRAVLACAGPAFVGPQS